jgi:hypothetical protein
MQKQIQTLVGIIIIVAVAVVAFGGVFAYQYFVKSQTPTTNVQPNPKSQNETYNHAGKIVKIYQKDGKNYLDIDFVKFISFVDKNGHPTNTPTDIYGENDENGTCVPIADPYCVVDNDKTIKSFEVAKDVEVSPIGPSGNPVSFDTHTIMNSPYFKLQIQENVVQKMSQIYIP